MSSSRPAGSGGLFAGAGALILLGSLWLPWYSMRLPDAIRDAFKGIGAGAASQPTPKGDPGEAFGDALGQAFTGLFSGLAAVIPDEVSAKGWQALDGADVALAGIAGVALLLALTLSGTIGFVRIDASSAARGIAGLGAVALVIVAYNAASPPGGDAPAIFGDDLMELRYGLAVAAAGALLMLFGGLISSRGQTAAEPSPGSSFSSLPEQPVALASADGPGSVAPPGWAPPAA